MRNRTALFPLAIGVAIAIFFLNLCSAADDVLGDFTLRRGFNGIDDNRSTPGPDVALAVGPSSVLVVRNNGFALRTKDGDLIASVGSYDFFAPLPGQRGGVTDPNVLYDQWSNRYFVIEAGDIGSASRQLLAVSKTANPRSFGVQDWYFYALDRTIDRYPTGTATTTNWGDFDHLGTTDKVLVITCRMYSATGTSLGSKVRIIEKQKLIRGEPITTWSDLQLAHPTTGEIMGALPAVHLDASETTFFLAGLTAWPSCAFVVWGINNPLSTPQVSGSVVPIENRICYSNDAVQPGNGKALDVGSVGFNTQPVYRGGSVWLAGTVGKNMGGGDVTVIPWAEVDVTAWPSPKVLQSAILGIDRVWQFAAALTVDKEKNLAMVYERSSATEFGSAYFVGRVATDPPNTLRSGRVLQAGTVVFDSIENGRNRFIDYSASAVDPSDDSFWVVGRYASPSRQSGTWVANLLEPASRVFSIPQRGAVAWITPGLTSTVSVGYGSIQPNPNSTTPSGLAIFGYRQNGVLVTEAGVPASPLIRSGRIYADVTSTVNTGLAIVNPNEQATDVSFYFTDSSGTNLGIGSTSIPPLGKITGFLNEAPFNGGSSFTGSFTLNSSAPVSIVAIRGVTNERSEFLITTLPVTDLATSAGTNSVRFPHFAVGGGWTTQIVLVNPTDTPLTGSLQFRNQSGVPSSVSINGRTDSTFVYSVPARTSQKFETSGATASTLTGSVAVVPAGSAAVPSGEAIFSFLNDGITVTEAAVPISPSGNAFRLYAESSGVFTQIGSIQTGFAVSNNSADQGTVTLELSKFDGSSAAPAATVLVPANGQVAAFLSQIPGFASLQTPFQGVLRVSSSSAISVLGLRGRYNERGDFLITTTTPTNEATPAAAGALFFPHVVDSGGYTTQFVVFSGQLGLPSSGILKLLSTSGAPLPIPFP